MNFFSVKISEKKSINQQHLNYIADNAIKNKIMHAICKTVHSKICLG